MIDAKLAKPSIARCIAALASLLFLSLPAHSQQSAEIQIRQTASKGDDFICWTPVKSRIRLLATPAAADMKVTLKSIASAASAGAVGFLPADSDLTGRPEAQLQIDLNKDGSWTDFYVAGLKPSSTGKDVSIRAELDDGTALATDSLMVRVRKNAETLTQPERTAFLRALATWKAKTGQARPTRFEDFYTAHADAFNLGIHSSFGANVSNFLPWHRAFLLNFERELQEIDPTVSLPYWKFDAPAPKLFSEDFFGNLQSGSTEVQFAPINPMRGWSKDGQSLRRFKVYPIKAAVSASNLDAILCLSHDPSCNNAQALYRATTDSFELNYHNNAHAAVQGWLGGADSPSDPLFFLLHANVDRGWAHWQATYGRFRADGSDSTSYAPVGAYPGPTVDPRFRKGLYALDEMWPWGKPSTGNDANAKWLPYSFVFPASESLPLTPDLPPIPAKMVDYLGVSNLDNALGVCYDDIGFHGEVLGH
jgi:tyrosinase